MGYEDKCLSCYGSGKDWQDRQCRKCGGSGKVKPYRRTINLHEGAKLGWNEMFSTIRLGDPKACCVCSKPLPGRKRTFCCSDCRMGYLWRIWKGAHWQKRTIYCRDGAACKACGEVFESPIRPGGPAYPEFASLQLDHIKPLHLGGDESPANFQLLCGPCHQKKSAAEHRARAARVPLAHPTTEDR